MAIERFRKKEKRQKKDSEVNKIKKLFSLSKQNRGAAISLQFIELEFGLVFIFRFFGIFSFFQIMTCFQILRKHSLYLCPASERKISSIGPYSAGLRLLEAFLWTRRVRTFRGLSPKNVPNESCRKSCK